MKYVIATLEEVAEPLRTEYEAKDGKFHLKVEGDIPAVVAANAKVVEFRDKNITLMKEIDPLRLKVAEFGDLEPTAAKEAIAKMKSLGTKGITDLNDFENRVRTTVDELIKPLRDQVATSAAETAAERKRADEFLLESQITNEFTKIQGRVKAAPQIVALAKDLFEVKDNKVVAKTGKFSTENPGDPLTPAEWLTGTVVKDYDFLFEPSKGGGAGGNREPGAPRTNIVAPKAGVTIVKNPTPAELGALGADIKAGKVQVQYDEPVAK